MPTFIVPPSAHTQLAKDFLRKHAGISLTLWRKIKLLDTFYINQLKVKPTTAIVNPNDIISYTLAPKTSIRPVEMPLKIAYEDDYLMVIDKPAGQLVHPTTKEHENTLANGILAYYKKQGDFYDFHPVHRLDKNTSGLVLIAKMPHIQHQLASFDKNFKRTYLALISGTMPKEHGTLNFPIKRHPDSIIQRIIAPDGQPAITHYKICKANGELSLVELELETGRTHQIRVHLAFMGHPLLGDDLYGGSLDIIQRQALHASKLSFIHPITGEKISTFSETPIDMQNIINDFY